MTASAAAIQAPGGARRLGFLGVGWIGRHRMEAILSSGLAEAAAICDPSFEMVDAARSIAPGAAVADGLGAMLDTGLDGVVIATPSALHAAQSIRALDAGLAVFCQKPLGRTADEVSAVLQAAQRADRLLGVDLSYRHTRAMRTIRQRLRDKAIGAVYAADLVFHNAYGPDKPWFYDARLSGGGCVMDLGVHLVDLLLWALDFPIVDAVSSELFAGGKRLSPGHDAVEEYATATLGLGTGAVARLACSWRLHAGREAEISVVFHGSEGSLAFMNDGGSFYDFRAELRRGTTSESLVEPPDAWGGRAAVDWAGRLSSGSGFDPKAGKLLQVARVLDRIYGR